MTAADPPVTDPTAADPTAADPPVTDSTAADPPVTDPTAADSTAADPPVTDPTAADPTVTDPPVTDSTAADPPVTDSTAAEPMAAEPMALMEMEPNDTILSANEIQLDSSSPVVVFGEIQDDLDPLLSKNDVDLFANDVDLFAVELNKDDILLADIDTETGVSSLNSVLSVFDINGNLLAQNDDNFWVEGGVTVGGVTVGGDPRTENDSFQEFKAPEDGTYYIGVSSSPNLNYDPNDDPNDVDSPIGRSSGSYLLELRFPDMTESGLI